MAKKILKDPNLSHHATRKFNSTVDKFDNKKFMVEGAEVKDLIEKMAGNNENFEVELN